MKKIYLKTPTMDELSYRKDLIGNPATMSFNASSGGTIDFDESKWESWFNKWIGTRDSNYFYAYIFDKETDTFVGEVAYRLDFESNCAMLNIIIEASQRGNGYGYSGLMALVKTAFKNGYKELRDLVYNESKDSHTLFEKLGFKCIGIVEDSRDYRLKIEDFVEKFGELE